MNIKTIFIETPNLGSSMSQTQCKYILTKGINEGSRCSTLIKEGDFCAVCIKKKGAKIISENSIIVKQRLDTLDNILNNITIKTFDLCLEPESMDETCIAMHNVMKNRIVAKKIMDVGKKMYDKAGDDVHNFGNQLEMNLNVLPGTCSESYSDDVFSFRKRLTNEPNKVDWTKFQAELKKLGVSDQIIASALTASSHKGTAAQFLEVTIV